MSLFESNALTALTLWLNHHCDSVRYTHFSRASDTKISTYLICCLCSSTFSLTRQEAFLEALIYQIKELSVGFLCTPFTCLAAGSSRCLPMLPANNEHGALMGGVVPVHLQMTPLSVDCHLRSETDTLSLCIANKASHNILTEASITSTTL